MNSSVVRPERLSIAIFGLLSVEWVSLMARGESVLVVRHEHIGFVSDHGLQLTVSVKSRVSFARRLSLVGSP